MANVKLDVVVLLLGLEDSKDALTIDRIKAQR